MTRLDLKSHSVLETSLSRSKETQESRRPQGVDDNGDSPLIMSDDNATPPGTGDRAGYSYPKRFAAFVRDRWVEVPEHSDDGNDPPVDDAATLEQFFSACYQTSLLREEGGL
jgi:hypothetical protein